MNERLEGAMPDEANERLVEARLLLSNDCAEFDRHTDTLKEMYIKEDAPDGRVRLTDIYSDPTDSYFMEMIALQNRGYDVTLVHAHKASIEPDVSVYYGTQDKDAIMNILFGREFPSMSGYLNSITNGIAVSPLYKMLTDSEWAKGSNAPLSDVENDDNKTELIRRGFMTSMVKATLIDTLTVAPAFDITADKLAMKYKELHDQGHRPYHIEQLYGMTEGFLFPHGYEAPKPANPPKKSF